MLADSGQCWGFESVGEGREEAVGGCSGAGEIHSGGQRGLGCSNFHEGGLDPSRLIRAVIALFHCKAGLSS